MQDGGHSLAKIQTLGKSATNNYSHYLPRREPSSHLTPNSIHITYYSREHTQHQLGTATLRTKSTNQILALEAPMQDLRLLPPPTFRRRHTLMEAF